jgi:hypothetical protein
MSLQVVLIAAVVSTAGLPDLPAKPQRPIGIELEEQNRERVAQIKRDETVPGGLPGGLPGRSETSEEAKPSKPQRAPASERAATKRSTKSTKGKEKEGKKGIQGIQ